MWRRHHQHQRSYNEKEAAASNGGAICIMARRKHLPRASIGVIINIFGEARKRNGVMTWRNKAWHRRNNVLYNETSSRPQSAINQHGEKRGNSESLGESMAKQRSWHRRIGVSPS